MLVINFYKQNSLKLKLLQCIHVTVRTFKEIKENCALILENAIDFLQMISDRGYYHDYRI